MSFILHIDTAVQTASIALANNEEMIGFASNPSQKDHASWLHVAIAALFKGHNLEIGALDAVAVSAGPGSYTGLRVGMAAAKGLCYALGKPLITLNTLKIMAFAGRNEKAALLCPMIDARRMEVFTAVFNKELHAVRQTTNLVLEPSSFADLLDQHTMCFFCNGSPKFSAIIKHPNASFAVVEASALHMITLSHQCFEQGQFADLAYTEPFYGKDFYSPAHKIL